AGDPEVDARHPEHYAGSWAEAVVAIVVGRVDRLLRGVARHAGEREMHASAGVRRRVGDREIVVREGVQADARIEEVAGAGAIRPAEVLAARRSGRVALLSRVDGAVAAEGRERGRGR